MEFETLELVSLLGFSGAAVFGAIANKTQFCIMGSISDWINMGVKNRFRAWMLSIGVAVLAAQGMQAAGWIDFSNSFYLTTNFGWLGYLLGGFVFGIGMTLGSGCVQRTLVRVGGGNLKSLVLLIMIAISAYMTMKGLFAVFRISVINPTNLDLSAMGFSDQSLPSLLSSLTGLGRELLSYLLTALIGFGAIFYAFRDKSFRRSFDNILVGITLGLLVAGAWYTTGVVGNDDFEPVPMEGVSFVAPVGDTLSYLMLYTGASMKFGIAVVLGMLAGSLLYALISRTFRLESFANRQDLINHLVAGMLMGFGGVLALGCTVGQGVTGLSTLALGSLLALVSIVFGSALTMKVQYYMLDDSFFHALRLAMGDLRLLPKPETA